MKPTKYILILLSLFLTFSCDDDTQTNEDTDDMMSLDWILLKKGVSSNFNVESCDGYVEFNVDTYDEYVGSNCQCHVNWGNECGECRLTTHSYRVSSCDGYELCGNYPYGDNCCYEGEFIGMDENGNPTGNWYGYYVYEDLINEYILYWNDDLNVCNGTNCDEEDWGYNDYDIVIPSHIPNYETNICGEESINDCERKEFFHPNCDIPLDTTMMIGSKSVSFEKMGWFERGFGSQLDSDINLNQYGLIHYYPLDDYIHTDFGMIDLSNWKVVDYQRKE